MSRNKNSKLTLFENDDDDNDELTSVFDKALKKKQFQGEKGKMLFELQKSINNSDLRFTLDKKFKDDVLYKKLPQSVKEMTSNASQSKDYSYNMMDIPLTQNDEIVIERNKNLSILSSLLTNTEYLNHKPKETNVKKLLMKRYDPQLNLGDSGVSIIKEDKAQLSSELIKKDNVIRLEKGVEVFKAPLPNEYLNKHQKELKKKIKEQQLKEKMNEINDNMNGEVRINYDKWKETIKATPASFNLFDSNNEEQKVPLSSTKPLESPRNEQVTTTRTLTKEITEKVKAKKLLQNKTRREKRKEKVKSIKEKAIEKEQLLNDDYKSFIQDKYGNEKGNEYLKYIELINNKKNKANH